VASGRGPPRHTCRGARQLGGRRTTGLVPDELADQAGRARDAVGHELVEVRYMTLDYRREEYPSGLVGKRFVTADEEWRDPTWRCCGYDSVDWGVQLRLGAGGCSR
jgi:hypothetical protein